MPLTQGTQAGNGVCWLNRFNLCADVPHLHKRSVWSGFSVAQMEHQLLDGATVDLRTAQDLSRYFRDKVVNEAELQGAA